MSNDCTSAWNCNETLPSCKGEPPRQNVRRIPPHTHLQVCPFYVKPPTWLSRHAHAIRTTWSVHARLQWYQNNLALHTFHILTRMSCHANQQANHVLLFSSSLYIFYPLPDLTWTGDKSWCNPQTQWTTREVQLLPGEQHLLLIGTAHKWTGVEMNKFRFYQH